MAWERENVQRKRWKINTNLRFICAFGKAPSVVAKGTPGRGRNQMKEEMCFYYAKLILCLIWCGVYICIESIGVILISRPYGNWHAVVQFACCWMCVLETAHGSTRKTKHSHWMRRTVCKASLTWALWFIFRCVFLSLFVSSCSLLARVEYKQCLMLHEQDQQTRRNGAKSFFHSLLYCMLGFGVTLTWCLF